MTAAVFEAKNYLQKSLKALGIYERARASWAYDIYWNYVDKRIVNDRNSERDFYKDVLVGLRRGDTIFDIGANQGYKTDIFLRLGAKVIAVEPDSSAQDILEQKFLKYRLARRPVTIIGKAISDEKAVRTMLIDTPGSAMNTLSTKWAEALRNNDVRFGRSLDFQHTKKVETISIEDLIVAHGPAFFVKVDVEGHEPSVLRGMRRPVPYLSFEVNLPEFRAEGHERLRILSALSSKGEFNYTPDCRRGLVFEQWIGYEQFSQVLETCRNPSIEIFWRTPITGR